MYNKIESQIIKSKLDFSTFQLFIPNYVNKYDMASKTIFVKRIAYNLKRKLNFTSSMRMRNLHIGEIGQIRYTICNDVL